MRPELIGDGDAEDLRNEWLDQRAGNRGDISSSDCGRSPMRFGAPSKSLRSDGSSPKSGRNLFLSSWRPVLRWGRF